MPRKSSTRTAQGSGSIRQRTDGRWEGRFTYTDDLGQKKRASVYADTQKECRQKLTAALKSVDDGSFIKTQRYTVSQWLDEWLSTYCGDLKPATFSGYRSKIETRIKPYIGNSTLSALTNVQIQKFYKRCRPDSSTAIRQTISSCLKSSVQTLPPSWTIMSAGFWRPSRATVLSGSLSLTCFPG